MSTQKNWNFKEHPVLRIYHCFYKIILRVSSHTHELVITFFLFIRLLFLLTLCCFLAKRILIGVWEILLFFYKTQFFYCIPVVLLIDIRRNTNIQYIGPMQYFWIQSRNVFTFLPLLEVKISIFKKVIFENNELSSNAHLSWFYIWDFVKIFFYQKTYFSEDTNFAY